MSELVSIIGIDPGLSHPGAAELCRFPIGWTAVSVPAIGSQEELVQWLASRMRNPPVGLKLVAIENVSVVVTGKLMKEKTNYDAMKILQCKGAAMLFAAYHGVPCVEIPTQTVKKTVCGNGNASKDQVRLVIRNHVRQWPERSNLNQTDAAAIALAAFRRTLPDALVDQLRSRSVRLSGLR